MIQNEHDTYSSSVMIIKGCMLFLYSTIAVLSIYYRVQYDNILYDESVQGQESQTEMAND